MCKPLFFITWKSTYKPEYKIPSCSRKISDLKFNAVLFCFIIVHINMLINYTLLVNYRLICLRNLVIAVLSSKKVVNKLFTKKLKSHKIEQPNLEGFIFFRDNFSSFFPCNIDNHLLFWLKERTENSEHVSMKYFMFIHTCGCMAMSRSE